MAYRPMLLPFTLEPPPRVCANGHALTPENTGHSARQSFCRICARAAARKSKAKTKAAAYA